MPRRRFDWMGMHDGVAHAIEPGALAPRTGGTAEESVAQGWPNVLRISRRKRAAYESAKMPMISRAKRSDCMRVLGGAGWQKAL